MTLLRVIHSTLQIGIRANIDKLMILLKHFNKQCLYDIGNFDNLHENVLPIITSSTSMYANHQIVLALMKLK